MNEVLVFVGQETWRVSSDRIPQLKLWLSQNAVRESASPRNHDGKELILEQR